MKSDRKTAGLLIAGIVLVVTLFLIVVSVRNERQEKETQTAAARAVAVLPPGVEARWTEYVDQRLSRVLSVDNGAFKVRDQLGGGVKFISLKTPYTVNCSPGLGVSISFGTGDGGAEVPIYGVLAFDSDGEPSLEVDPQSIAAERLNERLCARVARYLERAVTPQLSNKD